MSDPSVAIVHDYLTQRGGAERVVLSMTQAFPAAPVYASLFHPEGTYPAFSGCDVRTMGVNRLSLLRRHHRLALLALAPSFSSFRVHADVVLCSSSGWAHGVSTHGPKVVFCHTPARWLYQRNVYLGRRPSRLAVGALAALGPSLRSWDQRAARDCARYVVPSAAVRARVRSIYRRDAEVLPPPPSLGPDGAQTPLLGIEPGFFLCVSRLLSYKNVRAIIEAFSGMPAQRLVVVGTGPEEAAFRSALPSNVTLVGLVEDAQLRWLYARCQGVLGAAYEDFGLTPLEAATFNKPAGVLRFGGYVDTVVEGETGVFFDAPEPGPIAAAVTELAAHRWCADTIRAHAAKFGEDRFVARIREIVTDQALVGSTDERSRRRAPMNGVQLAASRRSAANRAWPHSRRGIS